MLFVGSFDWIFRVCFLAMLASLPLETVMMSVEGGEEGEGGDRPLEQAGSAIFLRSCTWQGA